MPVFSMIRGRAIVFVMLFCVFFASAARAQGALATANLDVDGARISNANDESGNWLSHGRTYDEQRYSPLKSIHDGNVSDLGFAWTHPTEMGRGHEASPIVVDGVMFLTLPWSKVLALDAKTGEKLWSYDPGVPPASGKNACCDVVNRGLALWKGQVYLGTIDGRLVALDAKTGTLVWEKQTTDLDRPYTITGAPRIVKDKVVIRQWRCRAWRARVHYGLRRGDGGRGMAFLYGAGESGSSF